MIKVYSELSLDRESIRRTLPDAQVSGPIARGDLGLDIRNGIGVVIMIDGTFHQNLAVAADEIMTALRSGIKVYGSSSMGAMRASELRDFGMIGYGQIYEHILASPTFRDDFLAQTFHEHRGTLKASSYPYIDFYMNVLALERKKLIKKRDAQRLLELYGKLYYPERCWPTLRDILLQEKTSDHLVALARKACTAMPVQKRIDAIGLLKLVRKQLSQADAINRAINLRHGLHSR